jgi:cytochrome c oxidase subunit 2
VTVQVVVARGYPLRFSALRRGAFFQMAVIGIVAGGIATAIAVLVPWLPEDASRQAGRIDFTYWYSTVVALVIFAGIAAVLGYCILNFRVPSHDFSDDGPPVHGNTKLEVAWTAIPTLIVLSLAIMSAIVLHDDGVAGKNPLKITVIGQQFAWTFEYPNGQIYPTMHVPINRTLLLDVTSKDVIHSFWVPQWAQKQDAVPGLNSPLVVTPDKLGSFPVICVELCGVGHSLMRSQAIVMTQAAYQAWYTHSTAALSGGGPAAALQAFKANGCAACHTFAAVPGANGKVGPSLDDLKSQAAASHLSIEAYVKRAIITPYAHLPAGYKAGVMPATFGTTLPKATLTALIQFIASHTH